jgi:predicted GNAT family acetyltransferase
MQLKIEKIDTSNQKEAISFLNTYENTSIFLLGNMKENGSTLTTHANSGNFKLIRQKDKVVAVFCLTRRGNLLVQSELLEPVFELIVASCREEPIAIRGIIGDWDFAIAFWQYLKYQKIITKDKFCSKEINYTLHLNEWHVGDSKDARLLEPADFKQWKVLRFDYLDELDLPEDLSEEEMHQHFIKKCDRKMVWGLFQESQLVSMANLNAMTDRVATVGGVYTIPQKRRKGLGKALMEKLIFDCKNILSLDKLIIFTGELENKPAQKLYESLGCEKVGYMALIFGE